MSVDEMAGWHHQCNGHEPGQTPGYGEGQGGLACCIPWGHKELDMTRRLNNNKSCSISFLRFFQIVFLVFFPEVVFSMVNLTTVLCLVAQSCLTLCDSVDWSPTGSSVHGDFPGKNTGVGFHALLQKAILGLGKINENITDG